MRPARAELSRLAGELRRRAADTGVGQRLAARRREQLITNCSWFDPAWYLAAHDDLVDVDPLTHYLLHGESEGRDPGPDFDATGYEWCNPGARGQALTHFLTSAAPGQRPEHVIDTSQRVIAEGWFDPAWYAARQPDLDVDGLDHGSMTAIAWRHYRLQHHPPGPFFDRDDFVSRNDVKATPEPLTAWDERREGDVEAGRVATIVDAEVRGPLAKVELATRERLHAARVAVAIHAFHLDVLDELLARLSWIPGELTVMVTTNDPGAVDEIDRRVSAVLGSVQRVVEYVPNAGRNFGPLLAGLDRELRHHDVVLHLHTKKSLASGAEQVDWRQHLVDGLLPSPAGVQAIVSALLAESAPESIAADRLLDDSPRPIGLVHPTTWPGLPNFANHWLGNRGMGEQLFEALGLDPTDASGWLDYPVGGMFWARTDALVPLLDLSLQFAEFGEELGQTDRTLAHAVERVIPASARAAGFDVVELDAEAGQWRRNWSERHLTGVGRFDDEAMGRLDHELTAADVVSVDLFDTLLLRPTTEPDGLFDLLAHRLRESDGIAADAAEAVAARRSAEHRLRVRPDPAGDVGLDEIEAEMVTAGLDADVARAVIVAELALEPDLAVPRTWLIERLLRLRAEQPDTRIVLMTDTTQPPAAIDALLDRIGAGELFHERYVSNDRRARKDSGSLWEIVETAESPERLLHLGDNPMSDLQQASDRDHHWFQVPAPGELPSMGGVELRRIGATGLGRRRATEFLVGHGLAAVAEATQPGDRPLDHEAFGFGVVGPLVLAFAHGALEAARSRGVDALLFGGRDGHLTHVMAERLLTAGAAGPPVAYVPMSRRAALGARLAEPGGIAAAIDAAPWQGTIGDLLAARVGVTVDPSVASTVVELPDDRERVLDLVGDALVSDEAVAMRAAIDQLVGHADHVGLVDLGYGGTILRALRPVLPRRITGIFGVSTAAIDDLDDTVSVLAADARVGHGDLVYDRAKVWEVLLSRLDDQLDHHEIDADGAVHPVTVPGTRPTGQTAEIVETVQAAALRFADAHLDRFGSHWFTTSVDAAQVRRAFQVAIGRGVPEPNELFAELTMDDAFRNLGRISVTGD